MSTSYLTSGAEQDINDPDLNAAGREGRAREAGAVETYRRGLKQYTGVERCQLRTAQAQRNHIGLAIRALVWSTTGSSPG